MDQSDLPSTFLILHASGRCILRHSLSAATAWTPTLNPLTLQQLALYLAQIPRHHLPIPLTPNVLDTTLNFNHNDTPTAPTPQPYHHQPTLLDPGTDFLFGPCPGPNPTPMHTRPAFYPVPRHCFPLSLSNATSTRHPSSRSRRSVFLLITGPTSNHAPGPRSTPGQPTQHKPTPSPGCLLTTTTILPSHPSPPWPPRKH